MESLKKSEYRVRLRGTCRAGSEGARHKNAYHVTVRGSSIAREADAFTVPQTDELFAASLIVVPLQRMSYSMSLQRGLDVDKPRNLAKSVTVE